MILEDRWEIDESSARRGGQAVVYKAYDRVDECLVAVKQLYGSVYDDPPTRESFNRELQALDRLRHPNIVRVIDFGRGEDGRPYMVLEWLERNLADEFGAGPYEKWSTFEEVGIPILRGLAHAHSQNQLHRDVKPENILFDADDSPKIADFGISKIADTLLSNNVTFAAYGTPPYSPPELESSSGGFLFSRDVYAFAVMSLEAIAGRRFACRDDALQAVELCDDEPHAAKFFRAALDDDPSKRPSTAGEALAMLEPEFKKWARGINEQRRRQYNVAVGISRTATEIVASEMGIPLSDAPAFVIDDLNECGKLTAEPGPEGTIDCLTAVTQTFKYRLALANAPKGSLCAVWARRLPPSVLQDSRDAAWDRGAVTYTVGNTRTVDAPAKAEDAIALFEEVLGFVQEAAARDKFDERKRLFEGWRRILRAKKRVEEDRGASVRFTNRSATGRRVVFEVREKTTEDLVGQPRYVQTEDGLRVRGTIEQVGEHEIVFYVDRGESSEIPRDGELAFDADASKRALKIQEDTLDAVYTGKAVNLHLGDLVAYPEHVRPASEVDVETFVQPGLDPAKKECVRLALGSEDLMVVEGPPGTGKTTFIAELVLQYLRDNPAGRVLLASQTHVALDNALERIRKLDSGRRLLRMGQTGKMDDSVVDLSVYPQMREWRRHALDRGRSFLRAQAVENGLDPSALEVSHLARSYRQSETLLKDARSKLQLQRDEIRLLKDELAELDLYAELGLEEQPSRRSGVKDASPTSQLEHRSGMSEQLTALEESVNGLSEQVKQRKVDVDLVLTQLAKALHQPAETDAEVLLAGAEGLTVDDERLRRLYELHLEWERRCGIGDEFIAGLVARAEVVAGTCVGLGGTAARNLQFDLCIVDEASKATSTEALIPMSMARSTVLVGDRKQLPPFSEYMLYDSELMRRFGLNGTELDETLFDRLATRLVGSNRKMLTHQHRMLPAIGDLISHCFYDGQLTSEGRVRDEKLSMLLSHPVVWYTTSALTGRAESRSKTSYSNELESRLIMHLLTSLGRWAKHTNKRYSVAVLTGYYAQQLSIQRRVAAAAADLSSIDVMVNSVDAFQGQEADVCIFSMTRSNSGGWLGFLKLKQRINVALSRAKEALVIVGDADFLLESVEMPNPMLDVYAYVEQSAHCAVCEGGELQ